MNQTAKNQGSSSKTQSNQARISAFIKLVDQTISTSVRRDPKPFVEAIFPAIGPAIRRYIQSILDQMIMTLDQILESSTTLHGLRWRFESWKTGRPYSEIAIRNSFIFRVEQVLFIHRKTGLLLNSQSISGLDSQKDEMILSGMITAVHDFVSDTMGYEESPFGMGKLQFGDRTVWIQVGPEAMLAAFVRGTPSPDFDAFLEKEFGRLHEACLMALKEFSGNVSLFPNIASDLNRFLISKEKGGKRHKAPIKAYCVIGIAFLLLSYLLVNQYYRSQKITELTNKLEETQGITITRIRTIGKVTKIIGLRDRYSEHPEIIAQNVEIDPKRIQFYFKEFISLEPLPLAQRFKDYLQAPNSVGLMISNNTLVVSGHAPFHWLKTAQKKTLDLKDIFSSEIVKWDNTHFEDDELIEMKVIQSELRQVAFHFKRGETRPLPSDQSQLIKSVSLLQRFSVLANSTQRKWRVNVFGYSDEGGSPIANHSISQTRATQIIQHLENLGLRKHVNFRSFGMGQVSPPKIDDSNEHPGLDRIVRLDIEFS